MACLQKPEINYYDTPPLAICLKKLGDSDEGYPMYARIGTDTTRQDTQGLSFGEDDFQDICVREEPYWIDEAHSINVQMDDMSLTGASNQDPCQFELSGWMAPEPEYLFCFRSRPRGIPIVTYETQNQWTIPDCEDGELRLGFDGSGCCAVFLFRDGKGGMFYVTLGVHNYNVWSDLDYDIDEGKPYETINRIAHENWNGAKEHARWGNRDRVRLEVPGGGCVRLEIRKGRRDGKKVYWVDILGGDAFRLEAVGPGCCYDEAPWKRD